MTTPTIPPTSELHGEISFFDQFDATAFFEGSLPFDQQPFLELLFFAAYASRQLHYLGYESEAGQAAGELLYMLPEMLASGADEVFSSERVLDVRVRGGGERAGKKRFTCQLKWDGGVGLPATASALHDIRTYFQTRSGSMWGAQQTATLRSNAGMLFFTKAKGFGFFSKGVDYYATASIFVLLRTLADRRPSDDKHRARLVSVAHRTGQIYRTCRWTLGDLNPFAVLAAWDALSEEAVAL